MPSSSCQIPRLLSGFRQRAQTPAKRLNLERETGIEPATNSLEGCDSTTELLPRKPAATYQLSASAKPQRLMPLAITTHSGTAKAVPFPNQIHQSLSETLK